MKQNDSSKIEQLLDLLLDALQERQAAREIKAEPEQPTHIQRVDVQTNIIEDAAPSELPQTRLPGIPPDEPQHIEPLPSSEENSDHVAITEPEEPPPPYIPEKLPTIHLDRMLGRLTLFLLALIVLINIPLNRFGTNLARAMPDEQALVIRDGLVLQGSGEEIYVLENNQKRWISSLDAFNYYGYRWQQVNHVDDDFLDQFPSGPALSILYKCRESPHVYAIENGVKRWIKDIPTFEAQGYAWEDVQIISCTRLEQIPNGSPIPPDAGKPPDP